MDDDVLPPPNNMVERPGRDRPLTMTLGGPERAMNLPEHGFFRAVKVDDLP